MNEHPATKATATWRRLPWPSLVARGTVLAVLYALAVVLAVLSDVWLIEQAFGERIRQLLVVFALGAFLGGFLAYLAGALVASSKAPSRRFAAMMAGLLFFTGAATTAVYALEYRSNFVDTHAMFLTRVWLMQNLLTVAAAVYQFAVVSLHFLLPAGLPVLFASGIIFSRSAARLARHRRD